GSTSATSCSGRTPTSAIEPARTAGRCTCYRPIRSSTPPGPQAPASRRDGGGSGTSKAPTALPGNTSTNRAARPCAPLFASATAFAEGELVAGGSLKNRSTVAQIDLPVSKQRLRCHSGCRRSPAPAALLQRRANAAEARDVTAVEVRPASRAPIPAQRGPSHLRPPFADYQRRRVGRAVIDCLDQAQAVDAICRLAADNTPGHIVVTPNMQHKAPLHVARRSPEA